MLMRNSEHRKELISEIRSLAQSQGLNTVFTTFLEITANSLAAQTDPENAEKREQRYQEMASTMTPELLSSYARMLALLFLTVREYRDDPCDILGGIYHELNLNNEWNGQYFTPDHICRFMAQIRFHRKSFQPRMVRLPLTSRPAARERWLSAPFGQCSVRNLTIVTIHSLWRRILTFAAFGWPISN